MSLRKFSVIFGNPRNSSDNIINLRKSSGELRHSSVIFGGLRANFVNFWNTSDDL